MPEVVIRKTVLSVEEVFHEFGPAPAQPLKRGAIMAVIRNPFAGGYVADIQPFMEDLKPMGVDMATRLLNALGGDPKAIEGYGKGSIVGAAGELEHGALWHAPGGYSMRAVLDGTKAIVPSTKKVGGVGARLDVPVTHVNASYVRSHFDSIEVGVNDAPRADELAFILVMTTGPRVHSRSGGLEARDIKGEDGQR
ncbi:amino acid synthesis family protein [Oceaniglobus indicus]|uniref:amino acid synthesis family protein n=1 Tax=Oceaniglobus indicus TaxID=2047749 RepID=UPI000C19023A|nr:amino acid synthesis family protein [Oceaniglobus indicus]